MPAGEDDDDDGTAAARADVGVTDDSVTIGGTFPLTGVAAPGYSEIPTGAQAYFDYVNANGGVNGRTIEFLVKDDGYDPTKTSTLTNELVLKDEVFATVGLARHADPQRRGRLPQRRGGAGPVRLLRLARLG